MLVFRAVEGAFPECARAASLPVRKLDVCMNLYGVLYDYEGHASERENREVVRAVWRMIVHATKRRLLASLDECRVYWDYAQRGIKMAMAHPLRVHGLARTEQKRLAAGAWKQMVGERARMQALAAALHPRLPRDLCQQIAGRA